MQNTALAAFDPVLTRLNQVANSAQFNTVINGDHHWAGHALATVATGVLDLLINGAAFVVDNWSWISPIVYGLVAAFHRLQRRGPHHQWHQRRHGGWPLTP